MFNDLSPVLGRRTCTFAATFVTFSLAVSASGGVLIGNPIVCRFEPAPGDTLSSASGYLEEYELDDCAGKTVTVTIEGTVDLKAGVEWTVPSDERCTLTLRFDGGVSVAGDSGGTYSETTADVLVLDRVSTSPDGFALGDVGLTAATVRATALVE